MLRSLTLIDVAPDLLFPAKAYIPRKPEHISRACGIVPSHKGWFSFKITAEIEDT
ncbi:hypothetical protein KSX_10610 [Ktedonospora formicarum]|uniref:Uncharacterized protein n=1 Tax=Ktedonospora formicarum TaxID=2778364 RepID=A0A8J3MQR7_9CHLR|nr:hypothetical protein KSX_10610 [Ktedonospora formicarum]